MAFSTSLFFLCRGLLIGTSFVPGKSSARHLNKECRLYAFLLRQGQAALRKERAGYGDYPDPQQPSACRPYIRRLGLYHQHRPRHRSHQQRHAVERRRRCLPRPAFFSLEQAPQCQGARRKKDIGVAHWLRESSKRRYDARKRRRRFQEGHVDSDRQHGLEYGGARKGSRRGAVLSPPFNGMMARQGFKILMRSGDVIDLSPFNGLVTTTQRLPTPSGRINNTLKAMIESL